MAAKQKPLYLVDSSIYIFRSYFAMPDNWQAENGFSTNAVYGFAMFLLQLLERCESRYIALAFDESLGSCFRNRIYPEYKISRALPDEELAFQLKSCRELAKKMGFATFASKRYEADDLIATLAKKHGSKSRPLVVVTRDKDLGQLLQRDHDRLWDYADDSFLGAGDVEKKFGVGPEQIADYLALVGDTIDDIPGVPGVGQKAAVALLNEFSDIETILDNLEKIEGLPVRGAKRIRDSVEEYADQLVMAKQLATLYDTAPVKTKLADLGHQLPSQRSLTSMVRKLGFGDRTLKRFSTVYGWD